MKKKVVFAVFLIGIAVLFSGFAQAEIDSVTAQKLLAEDGAANDWFGYSVAIDGDIAIVGSRYDDDKGADSGSAYVFVRSGSEWIQEAKLTAADGSTDDRFGCSVAVSGDVAVVGAFYNDSRSLNSGAAYVFVRSGSEWMQEAKLTAADAEYGDWFGYSVAVSNDIAIIGAHGDDDKGHNSGSAYVFVRSGSEWMQEAKFTAEDGMADDQFGWRVAVSKSTAIIGVRYNGNNSGFAYVFSRSESGWIQEAKLTAADGELGDGFGYTVAVSNDIAIIGAPRDDDNGVDSGAAYVFSRSGSEWIQEAKLTAADGADEDYFGGGVAVSDGTAIIGVLSDDDKGHNSGSAYVFVRSGSEWMQEAKFTAEEGKPGDHFGVNVGISDGTAIIGAYFDDEKDTDAGSAYIYSLQSAHEIAISSCQELQDINSNLSGNYYLAKDIDCSGFDFGDGNGFMPIGDANNPFVGNFDGKGFNVSNVFINRPSQTYYVGLFGFAGVKDGTKTISISHVSLTGLDITGNSHVGGLFGQLYYAAVTDVQTDGTVRGIGVIGGLGGSSRYSTITNAASSGSVVGSHNGSISLIFYGGLLASNERGVLSCSNSTADVIGNYRVGGLVGHNSGTVSTSFATGAVQGVCRVGGLAGENISGTISDTFATGAVSGFSGSHELGGLVGLQYQDGSNPIIKNSYATGSVTGGYNANGILGLRLNGTCSGTYWDVSTSGVTTDDCGSSGLTTSEMQEQVTYAGWDFDAVWTMNGYPVLQCSMPLVEQHTVTPSAETGGSIRPDSPQSVEHGNTASFEVKPDTGYAIDKVEGCGGTLSGSTYTTGAITADCAVTATFVSSTTYTVTPRAGRHGSLSPSAPQQVPQGTAVSFTVTPDAEYAIRYVSGCGGSLSGNVYTTGPVTQDCSVTALFKRLPKHFVIPSAGRHGSISPRRPQRVLHGMTTSFTVTPRPGYAVRNVSGCGGSLSGDTYTTDAVIRSCRVRALFR